jgi:hypothetical protein
MGIKDVTGMGMGSKIHQNTHKTAMPVVTDAASD